MFAWKSACILGGTGVLFGAFGAHSLKTLWASDPEGAKKLANWQTATQYQMIHALALLAYSARLSARSSSMNLSLAPMLLFGGTVLFSGSIYVLCLAPPEYTSLRKTMGPITPLGGLLLIGGWICMML
jgi:uncharacterized membrane protein YgdD (TMEM256/DUF423 family)